jgi:hypothetical protein
MTESVPGHFPDRASLIRLAGMLLGEQDDEWAVTDRRYFTFESISWAVTYTAAPSGLTARGEA